MLKAAKGLRGSGVVRSVVLSAQLAGHALDEPSAVRERESYWSRGG